MTVRLLTALLCVALASIAAACGGGQALHDASARGIVTCKPSSGGTGKAGLGALVYFYDEGSSSTGGPIVRREWNFDDGSGWTEARTLVVPHVFETKGNYKVQLRCTDAAGNTGSDFIFVQIKDKYDADPVFVVLGCDESDEDVPQGDGTVLRYHKWRWTTISYDPEDRNYRDNPILDVSKSQLPPGDPDFDLLRVIHSEGDPKADFCGIDTDGDGVGDDLDFDRDDDDPQLKRTFSFPHVLETSGRCLSKSKEDVYVWKIKSSISSSEKHTKTGHVTLMK
jgi:hypothetical protein